MSWLHILHQPDNCTCVCCRPSFKTPSILPLLYRLIMQFFVLLKVHATLMIPPTRIDQTSRVKWFRPIHRTSQMIVKLSPHGSLPTIGRAHNMTLISGIDMGFFGCKETSSHCHT